MPRPQKKAPKKRCRECGKVMSRKRYKGALEDLGAFKRRKFCDRQCMAANMQGTIKVPSDRNSRRQSAKSVKDQCEICGRDDTRLLVHHLDENPQNNSQGNLMTLCGSCHCHIHSPNFMDDGKTRKNCLYCSAPSVKKQMCNTHLSRLKRYGHPLGKKRKIGSEWVLMLHDGESWSPFP